MLECPSVQMLEGNLRTLLENSCALTYHIMITYDLYKCRILWPIVFM